LKLLLKEVVREDPLPYLEIVTDADNIASQGVIEANGGKLIERFRKPEEYGGAESLRYRIALIQGAGK
jgi:predicted acetyltransferase